MLSVAKEISINTANVFFKMFYIYFKVNILVEPCQFYILTTFYYLSI